MIIITPLNGLVVTNGLAFGFFATIVSVVDAVSICFFGLPTLRFLRRPESEFIEPLDGWLDISGEVVVVVVVDVKNGLGEAQVEDDDFEVAEKLGSSSASRESQKFGDEHRLVFGWECEWWWCCTFDVAEEDVDDVDDEDGGVVDNREPKVWSDLREVKTESKRHTNEHQSLIHKYLI